MSFKWNAAAFKKMAKKVGDDNFAAGVKESVQKFVPDNKIVMGRAKRGLYAGRHIQYGNQISEDGGNKSRRTWKPNIQDKRLFSYILDRHIQVKVSTHSLKCIDKAGGIDEYLLKTPYRKMDTELGVFWKAKMEKMYEELGQMDVDDKAKVEQGFKDLKLAERAARKEARRKNFTISRNQKLIKEGKADANMAEADNEVEAEAENESEAEAEAVAI